MTTEKCSLRNFNTNVNCVACNLNGTYIEETQEHIFLCVNFSQNDSKFEISEKCFQTYLLMNGIQKT